MRDRLIVVSPHLDDAVFGCGEMLAARPGAVVITVFAGIPEDTGVLPEWDAACGFSNRREAMIRRRREDREALERLDAEPCWLGCLDRQYRRSDEAPEVPMKLARALRRHGSATVAVPLGLFHSDHDLVHRAALDLIERTPEREWLAYAEPMYRRIPGALEERLAALRARGLQLEPLPALRTYVYEKKAAMECYESQLRGLGTPGRPGHADVLSPELVWRIVR